MKKDPICGMDVDEKTGLNAELNGETYYFCSEHCRKKFLAQASGKSESSQVAPGRKAEYICPMDPEVVQDHPGDCPKCGMPLEPKIVAAGDDEENTELKSLSVKFWAGLVLTLPVFVLAMGEMIHGLRIKEALPYSVSKWIELILSTPVVFWAGGIFFKRAWNSILNRSPNMFTLIVMGVSAAYGYSALAVLVPDEREIDEESHPGHCRHLVGVHPVPTRRLIRLDARWRRQPRRRGR